MRRDKIVLDEGMLQSLMELPEQYNYGVYAKFINDYGTHYITSGSMGGVYEYILVLDREKMESLGKWNRSFPHTAVNAHARMWFAIF